MTDEPDRTGEPDRPDEQGRPDITAEEEDQVRALLAVAGDPGPMPPALAARLDAALASTDLSAQEPGGASAATTVTPLPLRPASRSRPAAGHRLLLAAAATAGVLVVGGVALSVAGDGLGGGVQESATSADAGAGEEAAEDGGGGEEADVAAAAPTMSGRDYAREDLAGDVRALLAGEPEDVPAPATEGPEGVATEGTAPTDGRGQPPGLAPLDESRGPEAPAEEDGDGEEAGPSPEVSAAPREPTAPTAADELDRLRNQGALQECVEELSAGGPAGLLAADLAEFEGSPAAVLVLPGPDTTRVDTYVVGPGCGAGDAQVRYFERVPVD
jgi:hypothetical protein